MRRPVQVQRLAGLLVTVALYSSPGANLVCLLDILPIGIHMVARLCAYRLGAAWQAAWMHRDHQRGSDRGLGYAL